MKRSTGLVVAVAFGLGCGGASSSGTEVKKIERTQPVGQQVSQHETLVSEGDALWLQRGDRAKLEQAIAKWRAAVKISDSDWHTYAKLAQADYLLADGHIQFDNNDAAYLAAHQRGAETAKRGLMANSSKFEQLMNGGAKLEDAIAVIERDGVPLLYWYAVHLGKWAKKKGFKAILDYKDVVRKVVQRVYELAPNYYHGAADRYFGAFFAVAPPFAGGDLAKSLEHFEASKKKAPYYLGTYVLQAELYAPKKQDEAMFTRLLNKVINAQPCPPTPSDACILKGLEAESAVEIHKAKDLLARKGDFF